MFLRGREIAECVTPVWRQWSGLMCIRMNWIRSGFDPFRFWCAVRTVLYCVHPLLTTCSGTYLHWGYFPLELQENSTWLLRWRVWHVRTQCMCIFSNARAVEGTKRIANTSKQNAECCFWTLRAVSKSWTRSVCLTIEHWMNVEWPDRWMLLVWLSK